MNAHDIPQHPDEHVRFAAYLDKLGHVADANEVDLVSRVLTDPDPPCYGTWTVEPPASTSVPLLFRVITLKLPWQPENARVIQLAPA